MERRKIILIAVLTFICILSIGNYLIMSENTQKIITVNEVNFTVPNNNFTVNNNTEHLNIYEDTSNGIKIYVFDSRGTNLTDAKEMFSFINARDVNQLEVIPIQEEEFTFNYSSSLNEYNYLTKLENKNILLVTKNRKDLEEIIKSIKINSDNSKRNNTGDYQEKIVENTINYHPDF